MLQLEDENDEQTPGDHLGNERLLAFLKTLRSGPTKRNQLDRTKFSLPELHRPFTNLTAPLEYPFV
jgi:hypothetical protein